MKLDMGDGRMLQMPDEMSDEAARQIKRLVLMCEERAAAAEAQVRMLQDEMTALRAQLNAATQRFASEEETVAAIRAMHTSLAQALRAIERAASADRVMVPDELGEYTRSRIAR